MRALDEPAFVDRSPDGLEQALPVALNIVCFRWRGSGANGAPLDDAGVRRAVARVARLLGLGAKIFVPRDMATARREASWAQRLHMPDLPLTWLRLRASFWFTPAVIVLVSMAAAVLLVQVDPGSELVLRKRVASLLDAQADAICFVAKSSAYQVRVALETTNEENLASIRDSVVAAKASSVEAVPDGFIVGTSGCY